MNRSMANIQEILKHTEMNLTQLRGGGLGISFDSYFWGGGGKFTFLEQSFELYDFRFKNLLEGPRSPQFPETRMYIL